MDSSRHSISPHPWLPKPVFVSINRELVEGDRWKKQTNIPSVNFKASKFFFGSNRSLPWGWNTVQKHQQMYFIPEGNMHSSSKFESLASEAGWVRFPTPLQQACAQGWSVIEHRTFWHFWTRVLVKRPPPVQGLTRLLNTAWCSRPCLSSSAGNAAFTCPESTEAALGLVLKASGVWEAFLLPPTWFLLANHCCKKKYARAATEPLLCKQTGFPYACSAATTSPLGCHQPHIPERQGNVGTGWEAPHLLTWPRKQKEGADREGRQDHQLKLLNFCFVFFFSFNKLNKKSKDYSLHNLTCL